MSEPRAERLALTVLVAGLPVIAELPPESVEALRAALGPAPSPVPSPYVTADEAAELLRCRRRRIYELVSDGRLSRHGDGRRLLLARGQVLRLASGRASAR